MKVGILTITPNIGFGGILQAYALSYVLKQMGHSVHVINYTSGYSLKSRMVFFVKSLIKAVKGQFVKYSHHAEIQYCSQNVATFIRNNLNFTIKVTSANQLANLINTSFDVVVVGSDQVWRPKYVLGIENYFLANVNLDVKKISYAASFGVDNFEYSEKEARTCSNLLKSFSYVSVREESGLKLLKNNLHYDGQAFCDLDPTLLAGEIAFKNFIRGAAPSTGQIFSYILDVSPGKQSLLNEVGNTLGKTVLNFSTNAENPSKPLNERVAPPVEDWLSGLYHSDFIVTDSFHGCVFSILFNKPFLVYVNRKRGAERFISVLSQLNLSDRMIGSFEEFDPGILNRTIEWEGVNNALLTQRNIIMSRLSIALNK